MKNIFASIFSTVIVWFSLATYVYADQIPVVVAKDAKEFKYNNVKPFVLFDSIQFSQGLLFAANNRELGVIDPLSGAVIEQQTLAPESAKLTAVYKEKSQLYAGIFDFNDERWAWIRVFDTNKKGFRDISLPVINKQHVYPQTLQVENGVLYVGANGFILMFDSQSGKLLKQIRACDVWGFDVTDDKIYVACPTGGVGVIDRASSQMKIFPRVKYRTRNGLLLPLPEDPKAVVASGNFLYVSDQYHGLAVLERESGKLVKYIQTPLLLWTEHLDIQNNRAYVAGPFQLSIFDL